MKKEFRVRKNKDFKLIIKKHKIVRNQISTIYYSQNDLNHYRVGISVSKKVGIAVIRNKIRRQIKAILNQIKIEKNIDIIIVVKPEFLKNNYLSNKAILLESLAKIV